MVLNDWKMHAGQRHESPSLKIRTVYGYIKSAHFMLSVNLVMCRRCILKMLRDYLIMRRIEYDYYFP